MDCPDHPPADPRRRTAMMASIAAVVWIYAKSSNFPSDQHSPSRTIRSSSSQPSKRTRFSRRTDPNDQWKTRRRLRRRDGRVLYNKAEWEDDDDDVTPFHLKDDDTTNDGSNNTVVDGTNENIKEDESKGIIYSDSVGSKEWGLLPSREKPPPPPPPPPLPDEEGSANSTIDATNATAHTNLHINDQNSDQRWYSISIDDEADTILDDLARGFTFAALFCAALLCLHKCCWNACVRCGIFPDERAMEARWRRWQRMKKRAYRTKGGFSGDDPDAPPLDTRLWAAWMAGRADMGGEDGFYYNRGSVGLDEGVWDPLTDDLERVRNEWDDDGGSRAGSSRAGSSHGFIEFGDDEGMEMAAWGNRNDDALENDARSTEMVLEYGEGDELEDASHDSRLFDDEDGGRGAEREADKFFEGKGRGKGRRKEKIGIEENSDDDSSGTQSAKEGDDVVALISQLLVETDRNERNERSDKSADSSFFDARDAKSDVSENSFFDAMQPPSSRGSTGSTPLLDSLPSYDYDPSSSAANDSGNDDDGSDGQRDAEEGDDRGDDDRLDGDDDGNDVRNAGFRSSMIDAGDRGYDEETDLLGLRSDSPPPLDLEEIEKNLIENMEKSKFY